MARKLSYLIASTALSLGLAAGAFAASPTPLTYLQMDAITAGQVGIPPVVPTENVSPSSGEYIVAGTQSNGGSNSPLVATALAFISPPQPTAPQSASPQPTGGITTNSSQSGRSASMSSSASRN